MYSAVQILICNPIPSTPHLVFQLNEQMLNYILRNKNSVDDYAPNPSDFISIVTFNVCNEYKF
jgi:hypothetical protein